jgi:hypothetical protein
MAYLSYAQPNQIVLFEGSSQVSGSTRIYTYLDGVLLDWRVLEYRILEALNLNIARSNDTFYFTGITADESKAKIRVTHGTYFVDLVINVFRIRDNDGQWEETSTALYTGKNVGVGGVPDTAKFKVFGNSETTDKQTVKDIRINNELMLYNREGYLKAVQGVVQAVNSIPYSDISGKPDIPPLIGSKATGVDAGVLGQISIDDDFIFVCVTGGEAGVAVWKRVAMNQT